MCLVGSGCSGYEGTLLVHRGAAAGPTAQVTGGPYVPPAGVRWWTDLEGRIDVGGDASLFYLDAEEQRPADLAALHASGRRYLCYLSAGSWEPFRTDADQFPESSLGNPLPEFPEERWLDVRDPEVRALMADRIRALAALGCDGVPPSSLAVHAADTGFDLTLGDALDYARWLAERLHAAGMSAGLTGPEELTSELWPTFDFGLAIGCVTTSRCREYGVFQQARKSVLYLELGEAKDAPALCRSAQMLGLDALVSDPAFSGQCVACRDIL